MSRRRGGLGGPLCLSRVADRLAPGLKVRIDVRRAEADALAYAHGRKGATTDQPVDRVARDRELSTALVDREERRPPVRQSCIGVLHHAPQQTAAEGPKSTRDTLSLTAWDQLHPVLSPTCSQALDAVFSFDGGGGAAEGAAAESVLSTAQTELQHRQDTGEDLVLLEALDLALSTRQALWVLTCLEGSQGAAKARLTELADGHPLTVCIGALRRQLHQGARRMPLGCLAVIAESAALSGSAMWRSWCPTCGSKHKKSGRQKQAERKALRAARRSGPALPYRLSEVQLVRSATTLDGLKFISIEAERNGGDHLTVGGCAVRLIGSDSSLDDVTDELVLECRRSPILGSTLPFGRVTFSQRIGRDPAGRPIAELLTFSG